MGTTGNPNILFMFSGLSGIFNFTQNPISMDILAPKQFISVMPLLEGENIYNRSLLDNEVRVMHWDETTSIMYSGLRDYSTRDVSGVIPTVYFWDGLVYEFHGAPIQIIDVWGTPIPAKEDRWKVELQFKWTRV